MCNSRHAFAVWVTGMCVLFPYRSRRSPLQATATWHRRASLRRPIMALSCRVICFPTGTNSFQLFKCCCVGRLWLGPMVVMALWWPNIRLRNVHPGLHPYEQCQTLTHTQTLLTVVRLHLCVCGTVSLMLCFVSPGVSRLSDSFSPSLSHSLCPNYLSFSRVHSFFLNIDIMLLSSQRRLFGIHQVCFAQDPSHRAAILQPLLPFAISLWSLWTFGDQWYQLRPPGSAASSDRVGDRLPRPEGRTCDKP